MYRLIAYLGVLGCIIIGGILGLFVSVITLATLDVTINNVHALIGIALGAFIGGALAVIHVCPYLRKLREKKLAKYLTSIPENAGNLIKAIIKQMQYRKKVRADVMAELIAHFEDALKECATDKEKEQKAGELIEQFGDAKLLGVLLRRAKKRCRPLWRTITARTFQTIGVLVLCFIVYCVYISFGKPNISVNFANRAAKLVQLIPNPNLNAAPLYQKGGQNYKEPPRIQIIENTRPKEVPLTNAISKKEWIGELSEEEKSALINWLAENQTALDYLKRASEKPYCWWENKNPENLPLIAVLMPELSEVRSLVKLQIWQAKLKADEDNVKSAFKDLLSCYRVGMHFKGPRTLIEQLVGVAIQATTVKSGTCILKNKNVDIETLNTFQKKLEELKEKDTFIANYEVERFLAYDYLQRCYTDDGRGSGRLIPSEFRSYFKSLMRYPDKEGDFVVLEKAGVAVYAAFVPSRASMRKKFDKMYDTGQRWANKIPFELKQEDVDRDLGVSKWPFITKARYFMVSTFMYDMMQINEIISRRKADIEAAICIFALHRFRFENKKLPDSLYELVNKGYLKSVPLDPYSDKPLVYRRTEDSFTLYSVGLNFIDDGGEPGRDKKGNVRLWGYDGDAVFWPIQDN